jgi:SUKH-4 immunity protein
MTGMSPQAIAAYWHAQGEALATHAPEALAGWGFEPVTRDLLATMGLPRRAAPYLSFEAHLARVDAAYGAEPGFAPFVQLGTDGAGNPIVLNRAANDRVEWLDHDDGFASHYVNRSLLALARSLVAYHRFVQDLLATRGEDAYLDADFTDEQLAALKQSLAEADGQPGAEQGFWLQEISTLVANRAEYNK